MGGLKHSTAKTGKRQMQTDGGINRWHVASPQTFFELYLQHILDIWRVFWVLGHQVQVSRCTTLKNTQRHTLTLSISHTSLPERNNSDLLRPHQKEKRRKKNSMKRLLCEDTAGRRTEGMMREKEETWKRHQDFSEDKKRGGGKINVPFFSSIWFHFPHVALHHRGRRGKAEHSEKEWERAREWNYSHPKEQCIPDKWKTQ